MTITFFSVMFVCLLVITVVLQIRKGYRRGLIASLVYLALFVTCLLLTLLLVPFLSQALSGIIVDFFKKFVVYRNIIRLFPVFDVLVDPLVQMVIGVLLFLPVLLVLYLICKIIFSLIQKGYKATRRPDITDSYTDENDSDLVKKSHFAGAWVGAVSGILLTLVLLTPIVGVLTAADRILRIVDGFGIDLSEMEQEKYEINFYANDIGVSVVRFCGGDLIFNSLASAQRAEEKISLNWELDAVEAFDIEMLKTNLSNMGSLTTTDIQDLRVQLDVIDSSFLLKAMTAQTLIWGSEDWLEGKTFFGAKRPSFGNKQLVDPMITGILEACNHTTCDTVVGDLSVLMDFLQWGVEKKADFENGKYLELVEQFSLGGFDQYFLSTSTGELTPALIRKEMGNMAVRALILETVDLSKYSEEIYDILVEEIAGSLNDSRLVPASSQAASLNARLKKSYKTLGVTLPSEITSLLTSTLLDRFAQEEHVDKTEVSQYFDDIVSLSTMLK